MEIVETYVNPEDLKKLEVLYNEQYRRGHISDKTQFDYACCLVRSRYNEDLHKGIALLEDLLHQRKENLGQKEYLFFIAVGHVKVKEYEKALKYTEALNKIEPNNRQCIQLEKYIKGRMRKDGLLGMAIIGGAALALGGIAAIAIVSLKK